MTNSRYLTTLPARRTREKTLGRGKIEQFKFPLLFILLHVPLGVALYGSSALALLHPAAAFLCGLRWAINRREKMERVAWAAAYIAGSEVLWRMARAPIYWEFGKYSVAALMIAALVTRRCLKIPVLPLLYFILLLPACLITFSEREFDYARADLSAIMSGPFLLFVSCVFFSHLKVTLSGLQKILLAAIIPLVSVGVTTLFFTLTTADIQFNNESNFATSGGFGPNQVSAMLGLGVFLALASLVLLQSSFRDQILLGAAIVLLAAQSVMTFSRGGMYNAIGAGAIVVVLQMQNLNVAIKRLLPILGLAAVFLSLVFPFLNDFTGGSLQSRFADSEPTNRVELIESDYQTFLENPIFGVGVGGSLEYHQNYLGFEASTHTEFSRILSEHGLLGVLSLVSMFLMSVFNFHKQATAAGRAFVAGVIVWSALFMMNAGMRLAAPSLMFGLSFIVLIKFAGTEKGSLPHRRTIRKIKR